MKKWYWGLRLAAYVAGAAGAVLIVTSSAAERREAGLWCLGAMFVLFLASFVVYAWMRVGR